MEKRYYINKYRSATRRKPTIINLILSGSEGRTGYPQVKISVNNKVYYNDVVKGQQEIQFTVNELNTRNILSIEMVDKSPKDTVVHQDKIIKDKTLKIVQVLLDKIDIKNYIYTGRQKTIYHYENQGPKITIGDHLFFNGAWKLYYKNPVRLFLAQYHGHGQMINTPEKQSIKNKYLKKLMLEIEQDYEINT